MPCQFHAHIPELADNLTRLFSRATSADINDGEAWYPNARRIVREWATAYAYHDATVSCVIAAISPQIDWPRNLIIADDVLAGRPPSIGGCIRLNITKAQRLRDDTTMLTCSVGVRMMTVFPYGPKVTSFAMNLDGDETAVTVDGHAMQAALNDVKADYRLGWKPYMCFASAYELAAKRAGVSTPTFQAIIWHTWKRLYPRMRKHQLRKRWEAIGEY